MKILENKEFNLFTTSKNISEFFSVTSKLNINKDVVWGFYTSLKENCSILFPSNDSILLLENLIKTYSPKGNRVYDLEVVSIGLAHLISKFATVNQKDFIRIPDIQIIEV